MLWLLLCTLLWWSMPALAEFRCAGSQGAPPAAFLPAGAAKPARIATTTGTRRALVLFARFKGEPADPVPFWAADLFNPDLPGSFSHFYDTMSFGKLRVRGEVAPRVYESSQEAVAYLSAYPTQPGRFGAFSLEILRQADRDLDFSRFDNDGPDGIPNSGDDDGVVDAVFIVLGRAPRNLLVGSATGIGVLGFEEDFTTREQSALGALIRIAPSQGTIQQGRSFAEAAGAMCHEYGHVLGLPDLYNIEFLSKYGAGPEEDSAGVGAWCLMGWGASGWNGDDGPNSFCAWSRVQLGWSQVVEIAQPREEMRLPAVGRAGEVYQVPVDRGEFFLLEYRTRTSTYYDRHLPGEGLLIWHVATRGRSVVVDLECADGRWQDAGFPLGKEPESERGGDNLDFWAHDEGYARAHQGNLGDATDPFDGEQFRAFTPQTNPSSHSLAGTRSVRIEAIRFEAGLALARVEIDSLRLEFEEVRLRDPDGNGILSPGETADLLFWLNNRGGLAVPGVRTILSGADPVVHIDRPETRFGEVDLGLRVRPGPGEAFPQLSLRGDLGGARTVPLVLEVFAGETRLARHEFSLQTASAFTWSGRVLDEEGNGVGGITISFYGGGGSSYSATTAEDGAFQIDLLPGGYSAGFYNDSDRSSYSRWVELSADLYSEWVLPTTYPVTGTIRGPRGQPLPGVYLNAFAYWLSGISYIGSAVSTDDGAYTLRLPRGTYDISVAGWTLRNVGVDGPRTLDIDLEQGVRLSAQITGAPGAGLRRSVSLSGLSSSGSYVTLQTNAEGKGTVNILPGVYTAVFDLGPPSRTYTSGGFSFGLFLPVFSDTAVQVALPKGVAITGSVEDEAIEPFLNTALTFVPQAPYRQSSGGGALAEDGTYTAQLPPPGPCQVVYEGYEPGRSLSQVLGVISPEEGRVFDFTVEQGQPVEGWVEEEAGQGLAGLELQARSLEAGVTRTTRTQADGAFGLSLQPGAYELIGFENNSTEASYLGTIDVPLTGTLKLQRPSGGLLRGQVVDARGYPVQARVLLARDLQVLVYFPSVWSASGSLAAAVYSSGEGGGYRLRARPGTYDLLVLPRYGFGLGRVLRGITLSGERVQDLVLPIPETVYQVYGQLLEAPGAPGGEMVLQFLDAETGIIAQTNDLGYRGYGLDLPAGRYQVRAGLLGPVGGFQKVYVVGELSVDQDRRWDIDLREAVTAVEEAAEAKPQGLVLAPNFPNPFNPTTTIRFTLPKPGEAELSIYNLMGQRVATLVKGMQEAGAQVVQWDGRDARGRELGSGVYFYRLEAGTRVQTRKLLLLR